jgi:hypothetical protein
MHKLLVTLLIAAAALSPPALATEGYLGVGFGQTFVDDGAFGETDTGYKVFGGARFNPYVAAEVAYFNLGDPESDFFGIVQTFDVRAVAALLKGIWPVTPHVDLYGKFGVAYWETDKTLSAFGSPAQKSSSDGIDLAYGVGAAWNIGRYLAVLIDFEDVNGGLDGAALLSASLAWRF